MCVFPSMVKGIWSLTYKKVSLCIGFPLFKLDLSKGIFSSESFVVSRCEGARKTAVSWAYHCGH